MVTVPFKATTYSIQLISDPLHMNTIISFKKDAGAPGLISPSDLQPLHELGTCLVVDWIIDLQHLPRYFES